MISIFQNSTGSTDEFFLTTNPESSGSPPKRAPPPVPASIPLNPFSDPPGAVSTQIGPDATPPPAYAASTVSRSDSFNSTQERELTVDDIEDFEDDYDLEEVNNRRLSRRNKNDAADLVLKLPPFATGNNIDQDLITKIKEFLFTLNYRLNLPRKSQSYTNKI